MRRLVSLVAAATLLLALAAPAAAAKPDDRGPIDIPVGSYDFVITSDIGCAGFDVLVEDIAGRITEIPVGNDRFISQFRTITRYTNVTTGASFQRAFHSLGWLQFRADGYSLQGSNDVLVWGPDTVALGLDPGIWLIDRGHAVVHYDDDDNPIGGRLYSGQLIDVCAALS